MGSYNSYSLHSQPVNTLLRYNSNMKYQTLFLTTLLAFALAAPVPDYVDPDCVEEDLAVVEPGEYDCEDEPFTDPPVQKQETEECEDILTTEEPKVETTPAPAECEDEVPTTPEPKQETTEAECIDDIVTTTPQQKIETTAECEDEDFSNIIEVDQSLKLNSLLFH